MLESFKELFSSSISTAAQRVKNPALGAFALSWCAFNWKQILYLLLSKTTILDKITYIAGNSTWKTVIGYPCISVIVICGLLPWANNLISMWQARPLDNNDSIENHRKAKRILRATRLQRLQAKHDVTYDKVKTGAEKDIQGMKEQITESQARMGELTAERDKLQGEVLELEELYKNLTESAERFSSEALQYKEISSQQREKIIQLENKINNDNLKKKVNPTRTIANAMINAAASTPNPDE